jgi:hypothetical protein
MPECEDLEVQSRARSSCWPKREDQRNDNGDHAPSLFEAERTFNQRIVFEISGRHNAQAA